MLGTEAQRKDQEFCFALCLLLLKNFLPLCLVFHSTVTDLAKFRGWSTSHPRRSAI